jgi:hypothetical protein
MLIAANNPKLNRISQNMLTPHPANKTATTKAVLIYFISSNYNGISDHKIIGYAVLSSNN